jgi:hypothetical protein
MARFEELQFEELQAVWQNQPPQRTIEAPDVAHLATSLRRYVRRIRLVYAVKLVLVAAVVAYSVRHSMSSPPAVGSILLAGVAGAVLLYIDWRSQRTLSRLDFTGASLDFVRHAIAELEEQREPFRRYYWPFVGTLAMGESVLYGFVGHPASLWERIIWQLLAGLAPFAGYELGRRVRARRFQSECQPLVDQLRAIGESLKERAE